MDQQTDPQPTQDPAAGAVRWTSGPSAPTVRRVPITRAEASGPAPEPAPRRRRRGRRVLLALGWLVVLAAAAVGGVLTARQTDGTHEGGERVRLPGVADVRVPKELASSSLRLSLPWLDDTPRIERVDADGAIAVGLTQGVSPDLLPAGLRGTLTDVRGVVFGGLSGYRHDVRRSDELDGPVRLYATPTSAGILVLVCTGSYAGRPCDRAATSLRLRGARAMPPGPDPVLARGLDVVLRGLDARVRADRTELGGTSGGARGVPLARLATDYDAAARAVDRLVPAPQWKEPADGVAAALRRLSTAYAAAREATVAGGPEAFAFASRRVLAGERALTASLEALGRGGYALR